MYICPYTFAMCSQKQQCTEINQSDGKPMDKVWSEMQPETCQRLILISWGSISPQSFVEVRLVINIMIASKFQCKTLLQSFVHNWPKIFKSIHVMQLSYLFLQMDIDAKRVWGMCSIAQQNYYCLGQSYYCVIAVIINGY